MHLRPPTNRRSLNARVRARAQRRRCIRIATRHDSPTPCRSSRHCKGEGGKRLGSRSRDPIGYVDGFSFYQYANAKPIDLSDPTGHCSANLTLPLAQIGFNAPIVQPWINCKEFMPLWTKYKKMCQKEFDLNLNVRLFWQGKCKKQISPIIPLGSPNHGLFCCAFHVAKWQGQDLQKFGNAANECLKIYKIPFDIGLRIFPKPFPIFPPPKI